MAEKKQGVFSKVFNWLDKKMKEKAEKAGSCCCGGGDTAKNEKSSCCGK